VGAGVRAKAQDDLAAIGLTLKSFYIGNLKPCEKSAEELRSMGMLDMATYTQLQAADALRDAAKNPSGGAGLTAGIGAGMGLGNVISDSLKNVAGGSGGGARSQNQRYSGCDDARRSCAHPASLRGRCDGGHQRKDFKSQKDRQRLSYQ
jgi:membrane protease subunit (stomatin/prohibitin family)